MICKAWKARPSANFNTNRNIHAEKLMLCLWWGRIGVTYRNYPSGSLSTAIHAIDQGFESQTCQQAWHADFSARQHSPTCWNSRQRNVARNWTGCPTSPFLPRPLRSRHCTRDGLRPGRTLSFLTKKPKISSPFSSPWNTRNFLNAELVAPLKTESLRSRVVTAPNAMHYANFPGFCFKFENPPKLIRIPKSGARRYCEW